MSLSEMIAGIVQPFADLLPRIEARPQVNEWLVVDTWARGIWTTERPVIHIPAITHVERYPSARHPVDAGLQSLTTPDGLRVCVNPTVVLRIYDPCLLREHFDIDSWEEGVAMMIRHTVARYVKEYNWSDMNCSRVEHLSAELADDLDHLGIDLIGFSLEDSTECRPLRILGVHLSAD